MTIPIQKTLAYITNGNRLLVFRQPASPEAGIQVPGGTVEAGESLKDAVLREAFEETGLADLIFGHELGNQIRSFNDVVYDVWFFHLICPGTPPDHWQHYEEFPSIEDPTPILFDFFWVPLPDGVPPLKSRMDQFIPTLNQVMELSR
jgi:8-oxo-dGTP diphosphatase